MCLFVFGKAREIMTRLVEELGRRMKAVKLHWHKTVLVLSREMLVAKLQVCVCARGWSNRTYITAHTCIKLYTQLPTRRNIQNTDCVCKANMNTESMMGLVDVQDSCR